MQGPGGHCAALSKIFSMGAKSQATRRMQKSSPLLRSAARTPRAADDAETASSHSCSCSTTGDLHRIAPPPHLPSFLFLSLTLQVRVFFLWLWTRQGFCLESLFILQHAENSHGFTEEAPSRYKSERTPPCFLNGALLLPVPFRKKKGLKKSK